VEKQLDAQKKRSLQMNDLERGKLTQEDCSALKQGRWRHVKAKKKE